MTDGQTTTDTPLVTLEEAKVLSGIEFVRLEIACTRGTVPGAERDPLGEWRIPLDVARRLEHVHDDGRIRLRD